jgi:polyphosphate glucokinase
MAKAIGVDIGGTGIKAGLVDLEHGTLDSDRIRVPTPQGAAPADVLGAVKEVLATLGLEDSSLPLGVAFPAIVKYGKTLSAANVSKEWIGFDAERFFQDGLGRQITFVNDADAAGVAESRHGAARDARGLTFRGASIEKWAAYSAMEREQLNWKDWSARLQDFFSHVEFLFSPDLFVVGGGVSKQPEKFLPRLELKTPIVAAIHRNSSGIIGAASLAAD